VVRVANPNGINIHEAAMHIAASGSNNNGTAKKGKEGFDDSKS